MFQLLQRPNKLFPGVKTSEQNVSMILFVMPIIFLFTLSLLYTDLRVGKV